MGSLNALILIFSLFLISDIDVPDPDEKSVISYVSQLHEVFPDPPKGN